MKKHTFYYNSFLFYSTPIFIANIYQAILSHFKPLPSLKIYTKCYADSLNPKHYHLMVNCFHPLNYVIQLIQSKKNMVGLHHTVLAVPRSK